MPTPTNPTQIAATPQWWRDAAQAAALKAQDINPFAAEIDFNKLASGVDDESGVPQTGAFDRILASHFQTAPGNNFAVACFPTATNGGTNCPGQYQGNLQPYAIYVPAGGAPASGYGMTLMLHSLGANYNQYLGTQNQSQFANRGTGSITITPESRGPDGFNDNLAGADVFEVWADAAARYPVDPAWTAITGYSMGGMGTFKLAEQFPDLFAIAQPTVGYSASTSATATGLVPSLRNIPFLMWNMATDELVPESMYLPTAQALDTAGYRYELDIYSPGDHLTLAINDEYAPAAAFLGTTTVDRDPPHVTFAFDPALDYPGLGFVADHAYWLHALGERVTTQATGTIDVLSHGFGVGDPTPSATQHGSGTLTGGTIPSIAYASQSTTWGAAPAIPIADQLDINATNVSAVSVNVTRAKVDCNATLNVTTDGPLVVTLDGCPNGVSYWGGAVPTNAPEAPLAVLLMLPAIAAGAVVVARRRSATPHP
jgi:predicted esterase